MIAAAVIDWWKFKVPNRLTFPAHPERLAVRGDKRAACRHETMRLSPVKEQPPRGRDFPADEDPWLVVLETAPVAVRDRNPNVPATLAAVIDRALDDTRPALAFRTAAELQEALEEALNASEGGGQ
jgi:hypothetical protein